MTLVVNMVAGPGTGKSTTAAGTFWELKHRDINCELATEYAKDLVWEGRINTLENQVLLLGKQYHRIWRLLGQVDVVITDSPLFLLMYYGGAMSDNYRGLALELFNSTQNMTIFLERTKKYNPNGRTQSESEAKRIDKELLRLLKQNKINYWSLRADINAPSIIANEVIHYLQENS